MFWLPSGSVSVVFTFQLFIPSAFVLTVNGEVHGYLLGSRRPFRQQIFNLFNNTNFGQPDGNINNVTAGIISTADDARNMQFGLRFAW